MPIRFQCPGCKKPLSVKEQMAGKKASCPVCRTSFTIPKPKQKAAPQPKPADVEALAAAALGGFEQEEEAQAQQYVEMTCPFCEEDVKFDIESNGKREPCPSCRNLLQVPRVENEKQKTWRDMRGSGPAGAKINQMEKIEEAWGSETDRGFVSREAMEEADAMPEVEVEPIGVGGWIKRVFYVAVVAGVLFGIGYWVSNYMGEARELGALETAQNSFKEAEKNLKDAKALPRSWRAVYYYEVGKYYQGKEKPKQALENFNKARFHYPTIPSSKNDPANPNHDEEFLLADIAESAVLLGGDEDQVIDKIRLPWEDMQDEIRRMIVGIKSNDGQWLALRRVCYRLNKAKQEGMSLSLTNQVASYSRASPEMFAAQKIALFLELKQDEKAEAIAKLPKDGKINTLLRYGYALGWALREDFAKAKEVAERDSFTGNTNYRNWEFFKASLLVAEVATEKDKPDVAKEHLEKCYTIVTKGKLKAMLNVRDQVTNNLPLLICHMGQMAERLGMDDKATKLKGFLKEYQTKLKSRSNLAGLVELEKLRKLSKQADPLIKVEEVIPDKNSLAYVRALVLEGKQQRPTEREARMLAGAPLDGLYTDERYKYVPYLLIGATLGSES